MAEPQTLEVPNFGKLLGEYIGRIPAASIPRFLARLERGAADRYRGWAAMLPEHAELLLACAASEDEIATRADELYPVVAADLDAIEQALPAARDTYFAVFDGLSAKQQLALQAAAERQGSLAWQGLKREGLPAAHLAELDALTSLEIQSAERLETLIALLPDVPAT